MSIEMENARKLVQLEDRAKAAAKELGAVSSQLSGLGKDLKVSGWNWNQAGSETSISTQGHINVRIVDLSERK